jgi:hypothetical protein
MSDCSEVVAHYVNGKWFDLCAGVHCAIGNVSENLCIDALDQHDFGIHVLGQAEALSEALHSD